jgi:predicted RNA-binding Zn-ribbon protein involved in translation (DUF1610 family)
MIKVKPSKDPCLSCGTSFEVKEFLITRHDPQSGSLISLCQQCIKAMLESEAGG